MCHIHLLVCLIWIVPVCSLVPAPPTPCLHSLLPLLFHLFLPPFNLLPQHQGASPLGVLPALALWGGGVCLAPPLPVCMQIGHILIKRQLHILLKSQGKVGNEKACLSREAKVVWLEWCRGNCCLVLWRGTNSGDKRDTQGLLWGLMGLPD